MPRMLDPSHVRKILIIRLSAVGDVINTLPALTAVREAFPRAFVGYVIDEKAKELIVGHPCVDEVHLFRQKRWSRGILNPLTAGRTFLEVVDYAQRIRAHRYDVAIDLKANFKGGVHAVLSGVPWRIGFAPGHCNELNHLFSNIHVYPAWERINRVEKFLSLLQPLGVRVRQARFILPVSEESRRRVRGYLESVGCRSGGYAILHPGTSDFGKQKRWPLDRFSALARRIQDELGLKVLIAWGPGEREMAEEVARASSALVALETRSLLDLAELERGARVFVGCDSGPLHLTSAVEVPCVGLFGPKDPQIYGPNSPRHRVVYKPSTNGHPMDGITVEDAFSAVAELLRSSP